MATITLTSGEKLEAELADTYMKRSNGLSGAKEKKNMLFVFPYSSRMFFWMPFMHYSISMIFLNKDKEVVDIKQAIPMTINPRTWKFYAPKKAGKYVLETPFEHNIKIGDKLHFEHGNA